MSTVDHKAEAESLTRMLAQHDEHVVDVAHLHATLALVEQQRIANLIAYWQLHAPRSAVESYDHHYIEVHQLASDDMDIDLAVRKGLGL